MRRFLPLLGLSLLPACMSLSQEDRDKLALHQQNAKFYLFERDPSDYARSRDQIDRGLELEPDDYLMRSLLGVWHLKQSPTAFAAEDAHLDAALQQFEAVYEDRARDRHEPFLLLNYALALEKQGRRHTIARLRAEEQFARKQDPALEEAAQAAQDQATATLERAKELLGVLVERGEVLRHAHQHLMLIAQDQADDAAFEKNGDAYLQKAAEDEKTYTKEVERTTTPGYEAEQMKALRALKAEELEVRALLAEHFYARKKWKECVVHLDRALLLDPKRSVDYYNRGRALLELGEKERAKEDFRKFLATTNLPASNEKKTFALSALGQ